MGRATPDRMARLLEITLLLSENVQLTAADLAKRFRITERTVYRDMQLLSQIVPISSVPGLRGGYRLARTVEFDPVMFSSDRNILLALSGESLMTMLPGMNEGRARQVVNEAINRLPPEAHSLVAKARSRVIVDSREWYWNEANTPYLASLKRAVMESLECNAEIAEGGAIEYREVQLQPLGLVWKGGTWYLVSRRKQNNRIVRTRLSRLRNIVTTGQRFEYPLNFHLDAWWKSELERYGSGTIEVILKILPPAFNEFANFNWKPDTNLTRLETHWIARLCVDEFEWIVPLALSFAPNIIVLEPDELRRKVVSILQEALDRHPPTKSGYVEGRVIGNRDLRKRAATAPHSTDPKSSEE